MILGTTRLLKILKLKIFFEKTSFHILFWFSSYFILSVVVQRQEILLKTHLTVKDNEKIIDTKDFMSSQKTLILTFNEVHSFNLY